MLSNEEL